MICLTRLNHSPLVVNADLIEHIEMTPDTVISMSGGRRIMVLETAEQVVEKVIEFRRLILQGPGMIPASLREATEESWPD